MPIDCRICARHPCAKWSRLYILIFSPRCQCRAVVLQLDTCLSRLRKAVGGVRRWLWALFKTDTYWCVFGTEAGARILSVCSHKHQSTLFRLEIKNGYIQYSRIVKAPCIMTRK